MAKIIYEVYQNQNEHSRAYGKYYARVKYLESMNTRKLSNHIAEHGSIYTPDVVYGVMEKFRSCLLEMLLNSRRVKIEGLGTFYATIECSKGGAVSKDKFNVQKHINGLHIRFLPEQEQETNISSRQFLKQAEFVNVDSLLKGEETANGGSQNGGSDNTGNGSQNTGSNTGDNSGSQSGNNSGNGGNTNTGGNSGSQNSGSGSQNSGNSGSQSGSGESGVAGNYRLVIYKYGSGTSTVTDDSEQELPNDSSVASGSNVNISIVPAAGKVPTAKINGTTDIALTENDGVYTGSFVMPTKATTLEVNSEPTVMFDTGD